MGRLIGHKIKATTILETVIALVIITVVIGIATTIFVRVSSTSVSMQRLKAEGILTTYALKVNKEQLFFNAEEQVDQFRIKRDVSELNESTTLYRIHYYIYDQNNKLLGDWQQLVLPD
jgi:hypothetical protein